MSNRPNFQRPSRDFLYSALHSGKVERVKQCLDLMGPNNFKDSLAGYKALCTALKKRNKKIALLLLTEGVCVNHQDAFQDDLTPLHLSVSIGHFMSVTMVLDHCGLINARDRHGRTPLYIATTIFKLKIAKLLIDKGADVNICNNDGLTPLHVASSNSQIKLVEILLDSGAHINSTSNFNINNYDGAIWKNYRGYTALHCAVKNGNYEIVQLLLKRNSDVNIKAIHGITPFLLAMEQRFLMMSSLLINHGADVNAVYTGTTSYGANPGSSALHLACLKRRDDVVNFLVNENVTIDAVDMFGKTPLHIACATGLHVIAKILLERGASVNFKDQQNESILYSAIKSGNVETVEVVLNYFPDVMDLSNKEALKYSLIYSIQAVIEKLVNYGLIINPEDSNYLRFLSCATEKNCIKIIERAINDGITSEMMSELLSVATKSNQEAIFTLLLENGAKMCLTEPILPSSSSDHFCECSSPDISFNNLSLSDQPTKNPIYYAVKNGNKKMVKMLIDSEVNIDIPFNLLITCIEYNEYEIFEFLLGQKEAFANDRALLKAAVNEIDKSGYIITKLLLEKGNHDLNRVGKKGRTYLHHSGYFETTKLLLSHGAYINAIDSYGETSLFSVVSMELEDYEDFTEYLIEQGAGFDYVNKCGETPLSFTWNMNEYTHFLCLLKYYSDINNYVLKFDGSDSFSDVSNYNHSFHDLAVSSLKNHIVSLRAANLFVCDHYEPLVGSLNKDYLERESNYVFRQSMEEVTKMINEKLSCKVSYYDLLISNAEQFANYVKDPSVLAALELKDKHNFPIYGKIIYGKYLKWKSRMKLLELSFEAINCLSCQNLPILVSEIIFNYLNNQELDSLVQAFNLVCKM